MDNCEKTIKYIEENKQQIIQGDNKELIDGIYDNLNNISDVCIKKIVNQMLGILKSNSISLGASEDFKIYWEILEQNNYSEMIDLSILALNRSDLSYREMYLYYLLEFNTEKVAHFLLDYIKTDHSDEFIGIQSELAIYYLSRNKVSEAYPMILKLFDNEYSNVRGAAISFIDELEILEAAPFLDAQLIKEEDIDNVDSIVKFLAKHDYKPVLRTLQDIENDQWIRSDEDVHKVVLESIKKLEK